jgi:hypothetical protein
MPDRNPADFRPLLKPAAVRARAQEMLELGLGGKLQHFAVRPERIAPCADYVLDTIRQNYPTLDIPFHARWRHFVIDGDDRWAKLAARAGFADTAARPGRPTTSPSSACCSMPAPARTGAIATARRGG